ncbi:MAG: Stp1/IreP family PP2C-type Ser/Thr phosphatase [Chloroflexota bacterium]
MADIKIETGRWTDVGLRRDHNEDEHTVFTAPDGSQVLVVADGMGGHLAGEVASKMAVQILERELQRPDGRPAENPAATLTQAIEQANHEIWQAAADDPAKAGMGTTIVAAIITGNEAHLANAGDSPAYLVRDHRIADQTDEHGLVAEQVKAGFLTEEDAEHHPFRHMLTRCLGVEASVEVQTYQPWVLQPGDVIVLCSDGLTEHVKPPKIAELAGQDHNITANDIAHLLVNLANEGGGHDNITVVVGRAISTGAAT